MTDQPTDQVTNEPWGHAKRACVLLDNIHDRMRGGLGEELRTAQQKDLMATEALAHAVLALNETLNRIFPADASAERDIPDLTNQDLPDNDEDRLRAERQVEIQTPGVREHLGVIDLDTERGFTRPYAIPADDWNQIVSAAATARATGSVGAKSTLSTPDGAGVTYEVVFRTEVSDDQWKIKRTTPIGDVYRIKPLVAPR